MKSIWRENPHGTKYWPSESALQAEKTLGVNRVYYPLLMRDPATGAFVPNTIEMTPEFRSDIDDHFGFGIYYHPEAWDGDRDAQSIVNKFHEAYTRIGNVSGIMFDIEEHNVGKRIIDIITYWRQKHPTGPIAWTLEPFQGGWFQQAMIDKINDDVNMVVVVQNFYSKMEPAGTRAGLTPRQELVEYGLKDSRVKTFYDGKLPLPPNWDGCILSEERLPSYH